MRWADEWPVTAWLGDHESIVKNPGAIHYETVKAGHDAKEAALARDLRPSRELLRPSGL